MWFESWFNNISIKIVLVENTIAYKANAKKIWNAKIPLLNQIFCNLYYKRVHSGIYNIVVSLGLLSHSVCNSIHCQLIRSHWIIYFLFIVKYVFHISFRTHGSNLSLKTECIKYLWAILWSLLWWYMQKKDFSLLNISVRWEVGIICIFQRENWITKNNHKLWVTQEDWFSEM